MSRNSPKKITASSTRTTNREAGVVLALFVLSLPVLISLSVLALDAGRLYLTRSRLDKATRVASATALNMLALRGWGAMVAPNGASDEFGYKTANALGADGVPQENSVNGEVRNQMRLAVEDTMRSYFPSDFPPSSGSGPQIPQQHLTYRYSPTLPGSKDKPDLRSFDMRTSSIKLQLEYKTKTFLMGMLRSVLGSTSCQSDAVDGSYRCTVRSAFTGQSGYLKPANIFLLLDTSGSMNVPASNTAGAGKKKIDVLKEATGNFIDMFNPYKDRISLIDFGTTVKTSTPLQAFSAPGGSGHLAIKSQVRNLQAGGQTNPSDALLEVISRINAATLDENSNSFVLLFTDGAPNVYRLNFLDEDPKLQRALGGADASKGWYGWTVKWGERVLSDEISCPAAGAANCDPVWGWPQVSGSAGKVPLAVVQANLRINQDGQFVWKTTTAPGWAPLETAPGGPYRLSWKTKTGVDDNYKWYGPSYLVHGSETIPAGISLIDRIPSLVKPNPITCGTGSRNGLPGHRTRQSGGLFTDMYNHSRYFASRVIYSNWRLDGSSGSPGARTLVGLLSLGGAGPITAPGHFVRESSGSSTFDPPLGQRQNLENISPIDTPGCLNSLNAALPGFRQSNGLADKSLRIFVGRNRPDLGNLNPAVIANSDAASVQQVGEVVKTAELPYYAAIRAADWLRSARNVSVFAVGLGPSATFKYGQNCNDVLQNALDFDSRKDHFLRRLAFAPEALENPRTFIIGSGGTWKGGASFGYVDDRIANCSNHPLTGQQITRGYAETADVLGRPQPNSPAPTSFQPRHLGSYYGSNDSSQIKGIFGKVAKEMLVRLSS